MEYFMGFILLAYLLDEYHISNKFN